MNVCVWIRRGGGEEMYVCVCVCVRVSVCVCACACAYTGVCVLCEMGEERMYLIVKS